MKDAEKLLREAVRAILAEDLKNVGGTAALLRMRPEEAEALARALRGR